MPSRTPNFAITEDYQVRASSSGWEMITIPANSYLRPIELVYVPEHVQNDSRWVHFNPKLEVFCFCKKGMFPIPRRLLKDI